MLAIEYGANGEVVIAGRVVGVVVRAGPVGLVAV